MQANEPQLIAGTVDRVTYHNQQSGWSVLRLHLPGQREPVTVTGNFSAINPGEHLELSGWWTTHPQFGHQFKAVDYKVTRPATATGVEKYLGSGLIKGIGPKTARRIVEHLGPEALDIIDNEPQRLLEVPGIAEVRLRRVQTAWAEHRAIKEVMLFLQSYGVTTYYAVKIFKTYGDDAIAIVTENPYKLAADVYGIGFRTADKIARQMGVPVDSEQRLRAGLTYVLSEAVDQGHCFLPANELITEAAKILEVNNEAVIAQVLTELIAGKVVIAEDFSGEGRSALEDQAIYLPPLWSAERAVTRNVQRLLRQPLRVDEARVASWLDRYCQKEHIQLSTEQQAAVRLAARSRLMVLTGGPGTGKTTTLRALVLLFRAMKKTVLLASPTGRAAQRLAEVAGEEAKTLHRLLAFDPSVMGFKHNETRPLEGDVVIVDEASMLDVLLANNLIKALPSTAQLLLVGDVDQLPSVGPGVVLRDLIDSGVVPVARLTEVFRQASQSLIITNAHRINQGEYPRLVKPDGATKVDCYFIEEEEPERLAELLVQVAAQSLPQRLGYDPVQEVQVLCPMNRGRIGATILNEALQAAINPAAPGKAELARGRIFREGDKVIQRVNNYKLEVFNGDSGVIDEIDPIDQSLRVRFGQRLVSYDYADLLELGHGFAITVHKAQGSEYPCVVVPIHTQHWTMLSRQLLYTALTRAKRTCVLMGTKRALGAALKRIEALRRHSRLSYLLKE